MRRLIIPALAIAGIVTAVSAQEPRQSETTGSTNKLANNGAADELPMLERIPGQLGLRIAARQRKLAEYGLVSPDMKDKDKGVFNITTLWGPNYRELKVCFMAPGGAPGGTQAMRAKIAAIAREWNTAVPGLMPLNFGNEANPKICPATTNKEEHQIRISISEQGDWSLIGALSVLEAGQDEASMNFTPRTAERPVRDPVLRQTVLPEFGHALGLEHEHQNPFKICENEFKWPLIYQKMGGPPNNWPKKEVDIQMRAVSLQGKMVTDFDTASVMLYALPAEYFKSGTGSICFHARNATLSDGDKKLIAEVYPAVPGERIVVAQQVKANHQRTISANIQIAEEKRKGAFDFIDQMVKYAPAQ